MAIRQPSPSWMNTPRPLEEPEELTSSSYDNPDSCPPPPALHLSFRHRQVYAPPITETPLNLLMIRLMRKEKEAREVERDIAQKEQGAEAEDQGGRGEAGSGEKPHAPGTSYIKEVPYKIVQRTNGNTWAGSTLFRKLAVTS
ncbi:hypothetical protein DL764_003215 [Monosporascus ibericus]|uniref:Uncharacterized protein n=1 Tax=Monosporascus ibericus TaxID=155417 RepID=A0A4Q4TID3_9PEZI|nr:hypothetical protein DL764_003215 [Monosporascus ibericus]